METQFMFGTYCEVSIETLKQIKLKYIEDYEGLVQFLTDFHMLKFRPCLLAVDALNFYVDSGKSVNGLTKAMRLHFLLTLIQECSQTLLDSSQVFKANNTIVTYRCSAYDESDVLRLHHEFARYEGSQIFYLCKSLEGAGQPVTQKLLGSSAKPSSDLDSIQYIELFKLDPYPFYFEEDQKWKVGQKRERESTDVKDEKSSDLMKPGRPMPFKLT